MNQHLERALVNIAKVEDFTPFSRIRPLLDEGLVEIVEKRVGGMVRVKLTRQGQVEHEQVRTRIANREKLWVEKQAERTKTLREEGERERAEVRAKYDEARALLKDRGVILAVGGEEAELYLEIDGVTYASGDLHLPFDTEGGP